MPSIELICINQTSPNSFEDLRFAVEVENQLKSHRYPSKFQNDFDLLSGYIYHLGGFSNKSKVDEFFTAYELLSDNCIKQEEIIFLEFKREVLPFIQKIIKNLLESSPSNEVLFTSDYQFCENEIKRFENITFDDFCELHNKKKILFNASYKIVTQKTA